VKDEKQVYKLGAKCGTKDIKSRTKEKDVRVKFDKNRTKRKQRKKENKELSQESCGGRAEGRWYRVLGPMIVQSNFLDVLDK